jgi:hypothetical protein
MPLHTPRRYRPIGGGPEGHATYTTDGSGAYRCECGKHAATWGVYLAHLELRKMAVVFMGAADDEVAA